MPQFTNEQIAEAATRLYNQHPTGVRPETAVVTPSVPERPVPSGPATASKVAPESSRIIPPMPERPTAAGPATAPPPQAAAAAANWPAGETVALEAIYAAGRRMIESAIPSQSLGSWPTSPISTAPLTAASPDRLQSFLQSVRGAPVAGTPTLGAMSHQLRSGPQLHRAADVDVSSRPFDVAAVRRDFPILDQEVHGRRLAWLDNAATTQKPQCVIDALSRFYAHDNSNIHRAAHTLAARATDAYEGAREKVRAFLGAGRPEEIVFVRGTTEGINLVTQTYGRKFLQPGDEIILSVLEHHANIVPWQMVAQERGALLRVIPVNDRGEIIMEEYQRLLGPRTRIVALTQASNSLGTILPVAEMTQAAKRYGARVLIDGAQSVAHLPVNVRQLDCDFFVFSGHKIFGPTGIGAVYAKQELLEIMPPWQGGGSMIKDVTFEETTYSAPPAKFEAGTPNIADAVGLGAALDYVNRLGLPNIARYEHELLEYGTAQLARIDGLRLVGTAREKVGVLSFVLPGRDTVEVGKRLDLEGIAVRAGHHCAQPSLRRFGLESTVRPSLSIYNTRDEIDRLAEAIRRILHR